MTLFNKPSTQPTPPFNREEVLKDTLEMLKTDFPHYKVITPQDGDGWDLMIIRTVSVSLVQKLGALGLHETVKEGLVQEVYTVNAHPIEDITYPLNPIPDDTRGWTTAHINISKASTLKQRLL